MDRPWYVGNADDDAGENRSWLVGHFKKPDDIRHSKDTEVKWSTHPAGDERADWNPGVHTGTVLILVSGRWELHLRHEGGQVDTVVMNHPGDYVVWGPGTDHTWKALADSVMVTVRWPSLD
jgi:hypothetical protein